MQALGSINIGYISDIPVIGPLLFSYDPLVYLSFILTLSTGWFLTKTRRGLILRAIGENQVRAIIHLVSSSVPLLTAERVSVVDQYGALLSQPINDPAMALNNTQLQYKIKLENYYKDRVLRILGPLYGAGNVQTSLNIDIDAFLII